MVIRSTILSHLYLFRIICNLCTLSGRRSSVDLRDHAMTMMRCIFHSDSSVTLPNDISKKFTAQIRATEL